VIVPNGASIAAFDGCGRMMRSYEIDSPLRDRYNICVPVLGAAKILPGKDKSIVAALASGAVIALDVDFNLIWKTETFRSDFEHEIFFADVDGDGLDEIAFGTQGEMRGGNVQPL